MLIKGNLKVEAPIPFKTRERIYQTTWRHFCLVSYWNIGKACFRVVTRKPASSLRRQNCRTGFFYMHRINSLDLYSWLHASACTGERVRKVAVQLGYGRVQLKCDGTRWRMGGEVQACIDTRGHHFQHLSQVHNGRTTHLMVVNVTELTWW